MPRAAPARSGGWPLVHCCSASHETPDPPVLRSSNRSHPLGGNAGATCHHDIPCFIDQLRIRSLLSTSCLTMMFSSRCWVPLTNPGGGDGKRMNASRTARYERPGPERYRPSISPMRSSVILRCSCWRLRKNASAPRPADIAAVLVGDPAAGEAFFNGRGRWRQLPLGDW